MDLRNVAIDPRRLGTPPTREMIASAFLHLRCPAPCPKGHKHQDRISERYVLKFRRFAERPALRISAHGFQIAYNLVRGRTSLPPELSNVGRSGNSMTQRATVCC